MSNRDRVLSYLRSIAPTEASNAEIVSHTGIRPHQHVFMITRDLMRQKLIKGIHSGKEWRFTTSDQPRLECTQTPDVPEAAEPRIVVSPVDFEKLARRAMEAHFGTRLAADRVDGIRKTFDLVSQDHKIVGDAKYFTMVQGERLPPAKFSVISEHVWLLEKTSADRRFLVFGNDQRVPLEWLKRHGPLVRSVEFYFLDAGGQLQRLNASASGRS